MTTLTTRLELASSKTAARIPTSASAGPKHTGPSNVTLFITNLRILDLDCREDWPGITATTFSTKNTQQNQRSRVQCVEWALFQLFAIWDPAETKDKLQPFFPPLEPLQSLNLRAALFRCLDHAKKNGVLGRDAVLRKTMLDECKGDRLEEVLAVFSTVVLKKVVVESTNMDSIALQLTMENFSYFGERSMLTALVMAHKASLSKGLREKEKARVRYREFAGLLSEKQGQFLKRHDLLKQSIATRENVKSMPREDMDRLYDRVQKSWAGSNEWLKTICHGDGRFERDGLMARPYEETWKQVVNGTLNETENKKPKGLLEQLDARVQEQQHRLEKWRKFEKSLNKPGTPKPRPATEEALQDLRGIDLGFTAHQNITFHKENATVSEGTRSALSEDYGQLLTRLKAELESVGKSKPKAAGRRVRQFVPDEDFDTSMETIQRNSSSESLTENPEKKEPNLQHDSDAEWQSQEEDEEGGEEIVEAEEQTPAPTSSDTAIPSIEIESESESESDVESTFSAIAPRMQETPEPEAEDRIQRAHSTQASPSPQQVMLEESEADRILNSMAAASPSPVKRSRHKLSLAERTQLSMSRSSKSFSADLDEPHDFPALALRPIASPTRDNRQLDPHADLIARTQQSMSGFAAAQKKAQLERRQSLRSAKKNERAVGNFPPPLQSPEEDGEEQDNKFDRDALIEGSHEVDYESAFKSRPKIALSPSMSPVKWDDGDSIELSSPLGRMGR